MASKPSVWLNTYTFTKHTAEKMANLMTRYHPVKITVLRLLNIYGPGQKLYPVRKILPTFAAKALRGLPLEVYGDGMQTVDMLYSKDAARLIVAAMRGKFNPNAMDCGTGVEMTIREVAESVNRYYGNTAGIRCVAMRKGETPGTRLVAADTRDLVNAVGSLDLTPYQEALGHSLEYYKSLDAHEIDAALNFHGISQTFDMSWT
jgi:UDP-glucose 4-epimerase